MQPFASEGLLTGAQSWDDLSRDERAELGRAFRHLGWTYGEIMQVIPVPKGTLAYWCREIRLTEQQIEAIKARANGQKGVPRDTQHKRRAEVERIQRAARAEVPSLAGDPLWLAGTVMYWAEGAKTKSMLAVANADPRVLRLFIRWVRKHHEPQAAFVLSLHLHHGNNELEAQRYWARALPLEDPEFYKTFIKPPGTGHRKNRLQHGVCRVLMRRSADAWHRTMAWIDGFNQAIEANAGNS